MKKGEIWIASLDPRKGFEVGKQWPVVIVQTDLLNDVDHPTAVILPISSQRQEENILRHKIQNSGLSKGFGYVLIDQPRTIDARHRFKKKIGELTSREIHEIGELIKHVFDLG